jgi:hypothetical protein
MSAHFLIKVAMVAGERLFKEEPMVEAVRAAIDATADQFVQLEGVRENLQKWQDSPEFAGLLARLQKAEIAPESADLAGSFISTGFYVPEKMSEVAESILDSFAENLRGELLKTDIGLQILADTAEKGLQPTRSRFADKILEIYRDFSLYMVCGGDSIYHQQTLSQYLDHCETMPTTDPNEVDLTCRQLATDILDRLGTIAEIADSAATRVEYLRTPYGIALNSNMPMAAEYEKLIDALESIMNLAPRRPASSYSDVRARARVPNAIGDLSVCITQATLFDSAFKRFYKHATGHPFTTDGPESDRLRNALAWYQRYYLVLQRLWRSIADCRTLGKDEFWQ